jgi:hypothetical protein
MSTKRKIIIIIRLLFTITLLFGIGLFISNYYYWKAPSRSVYRISKTVPKRDIGYNNGFNNSLGFINADGTEKTQVQFPFNFRRPEISKDGNYIYGVDDRVLSRSVYWDINAHKVYACHPDQWGANQQVVGMEDPDHPEYALVDNNDRILLLDIKKCEIIKVIVEVGGGTNGFYGISYNSETNELLYGIMILDYSEWVENHFHSSDNYQVRKLDINSGKDEQIGIGVYPSWSPDYSKISFTGVDGIYVMNSDGSNIQNIFDYPYEKFGFYWSSYPQWSPDSKWLVFHFCDGRKIVKPAQICLEEPIYKIPSTGGTPIKITEDGKFPFWIP